MVEHSNSSTINIGLSPSSYPAFPLLSTTVLLQPNASRAMHHFPHLHHLFNLLFHILHCLLSKSATVIKQLIRSNLQQENSWLFSFSFFSPSFVSFGDWSMPSPSPPHCCDWTMQHQNRDRPSKMMLINAVSSPMARGFNVWFLLPFGSLFIRAVREPIQQLKTHLKHICWI